MTMYIPSDLAPNAQNIILEIERRLVFLERRIDHPEVTTEMLSKLRDDMRRDLRAAIGEPTYRDWEEVFGGPVVVSRGGMTLRPIPPSTVTIDGALSITGALDAMPRYGLWSKSAMDAAGTGLYAWDVEVYNPNATLYQRVSSNTKIQINETGHYDIRVNLGAYDLTAAVGSAVGFLVDVNAASVIATQTILDVTHYAFCHVTKVVGITAGDQVSVSLNSPATSQKGGSASGAYVFLEIAKVN